MKRLILHIGTHKTGTTAIQSFLRDNAPLLEQSGLFFPEYPREYLGAAPGRNAHFLHCQTMYRLYGKRAYGDGDGKSDWVRERFVEQIASHDTILLSDEPIWYNVCTVDGYLDCLLSLIRECGIEQIDIVLYLRRQDEYAESLWKQWVKSDRHERTTFDEYMRRYAAKIGKFLDYAAGVELLEGALGKDRIILRRYQRSLFVEEDVRWDFADAVGFSITDEYRFPPSSSDLRVLDGNVSLSNNLTEITRIANLSPTYCDGFCKEVVDIARTTSLASQETGGNYSVMKPKQRESLLARYADGNAMLAREYFGISDGSLFEAPDPDSPVWQADTESLQHDAILLFTEAYMQERSKRRELERRLRKVERRLKRMEKGYQGLIEDKREQENKQARKIGNRIKRGLRRIVRRK